MLLLYASGGLIIVTTSGRICSSIENTRVNCSSKDFRGSTLVGDKHVSNTDLGSDDKLNDCFFFVLGVLLDVRNNRLRFSVDVTDAVLLLISFSRGGLPVFCGSEF